VVGLKWLRADRSRHPWRSDAGTRQAIFSRGGPCGKRQL